MQDWNWLAPEDLAEFDWSDEFDPDEGIDPVDGLVPFATDNDGQFLCWYLPETVTDGEPVIVRFGCGTPFGEYFAPSLAGAIFRQTIENVKIITETPEEWERNKQDIDDVLPVLNEYTPKPWCKAITAVQNLELITNEFGDPALMLDKDFEKIIQKAFGQDYVDRQFPWDKQAREDE